MTATVKISPQITIVSECISQTFKKFLEPLDKLSLGAKLIKDCLYVLSIFSFNHWFDGMALMHSFQIADGQVTYSSRFLRSDSYKQNSEMNRIVMSEFGTLAVPDPCKNIFQRFMSSFKTMSECPIVSWLKMQKCSDVVVAATQFLVKDPGFVT